jgi:uncharacterized protein YjbI with pentapeptide repeats
MSLHNYNGASIPDDILEKLKSSFDFNARNSQLENIEIESDSLRRVDLKYTKKLKNLSLNCINLGHIALAGTGVEVLKVTSLELLEISLKRAKNLKELSLKTPNLEHIEIDSEKLDIFDISNFRKLKSINHIYKEEAVSVKDFVENFTEIEKSEIDKISHSGGCGCGNC